VWEVGAPQHALRGRLDQLAGERDRVVERFAREGIAYRSFGRRRRSRIWLPANGKEGPMTRIFPVAGVIVVLAWAQSAVADPSLKDLAARTELRAIETLTLTDQQFLTGDKSGKAVTIAGELRFPQVLLRAGCQP
jgi:hypothetical protein